jgi:predicted RNA-binding protein with PIN domain
MPYLIDGHNVIAQMSGISLDDPNDEAKLVILLRQYTASVGKRVHVVFDGGIPGGSSPLSTSRVQVYFASADSSADNVLRTLIRNTTNPSGWIVVSSDRAIVEVARHQGMRAWRSERFAQRLEQMQAAQIQEENDAYVPPTKTDPQLSKDEVEEWLDIFSDNNS